MSIFYTAFLENPCEFDELKKTVESIMPGNSKESVSNNIWRINCSYFSVSLLNNKKFAEQRSRDYGIPFNHMLWFDIHYNTPEWLTELLKFSGKLLKQCDGNFILESNGETCILMRRSNEVTINEERLSGNDAALLNALDIKFKLGRIQQV